MRSAALLRISIHAPHAGRDRRFPLQEVGRYPFQSTRPMRGATPELEELALDVIISIHAPHAGRDEVRHG